MNKEMIKHEENAAKIALADAMKFANDGKKKKSKKAAKKGNKRIKAFVKGNKSVLNDTQLKWFETMRALLEPFK